MCLVFQRVFWAKPFTSGVDEWAYITVGFQCLNCRLIVFGTRFRDFQHDCATRELK